jgi:hypothetical protein
MKKFISVLVLGFSVALSAFSSVAYAVDAFEIQVYDAEINSVGEYTWENHLNHDFSGKKIADFDGQVSFDHLTHWTLEFARGMTEYWELGAYVQTALSSAPQAYFGGAKLRSKFVLPRSKFGPYHFGLNFEISDVPQGRFEEQQWAMEIRPIIGYSWQKVTVLFNPILSTDLSGDSHVPEFEPALKAFYQLFPHDAFGFEYYAGLGQLNQIAGYATQEHYLFGAFDLIDAPYELNLGLGRGLTDHSNPWTLKAIIGFKL